MDNPVGCNIVHPDCDKAEMYTRDVYIERLSAYRRYGFRHVEFSHVTAIDEGDAEAIRAHAQLVGVVPWSVHGEHLNADGQAALEEYLRIQTHCARMARALGVTLLVCHLPHVEPYAAAPRRDTDILSRLADITDSRDLKLAVETTCPAPTDYLIGIVDAINRPSVGVNLDTGHVVLQDEDPAEMARKIGPRLMTTHLQDNFGANDDHQAPGMGRIDWRSLLRALKEIGYAGPLMVELTGEGVKANRSSEEMRDFALEKEIIFTLAYLRHLAGEIT